MTTKDNCASQVKIIKSYFHSFRLFRFTLSRLLFKISIYLDTLEKCATYAYILSKTQTQIRYCRKLKVPSSFTLQLAHIVDIRKVNRSGLYIIHCVNIWIKLHNFMFNFSSFYFHFIFQFLLHYFNFQFSSCKL